MTEQQFNQLADNAHIQQGGKTRAALHAVLVGGRKQAEACRDIGIARPTLSKALAKVGAKITYTTQEA